MRKRSVARAALLEILESRILFSISPALAAPALAASSDTGVSQTDGITSHNNSAPSRELTFTVTAAATNATVFLYEDDTLVATVTPATGTAVSTISTDGETVIVDGDHAFTVRQQVPGEDLSDTSGAATVTVDTQAPSGPGSRQVFMLTPETDTDTPGDNITGDTSPAFNLPTIPGVYYAIDWDVGFANPTYFAGGVYETGHLQDGPELFYVRYADAAGNTASHTDTAEVVVRSFAPTLGHSALFLDTNGPYSIGTPLKLFASVVMDTGPTPESSVVFMDNGKYLGTSPLSEQGHASFTITAPTVGVHHFSGTVLPTATTTADTIAAEGVTIPPNRPAYGLVNTRSLSLISGVAIDPDLPANVPAVVRIDVDNKTVAVMPVSLSTHTFLYNPHLNVGTHHVTVWVYNYPTPTLSRLADFVVTDHPATATIKSVSNTKITGSATDPDLPAGAVTLVVLVDNLPATILAANQTIAGLPADHAFSYTLPTLPHGTHHLTLMAVDTSAGIVSFHETITLTI